MKTLVFLMVVMACNAYVDDSLKVPFYRYWNSNIFDHFYTPNWNELGGGKNNYEYQQTQCKIWKYQQPGTVSLYRYWNGKDHLYTTSLDEIGTTVPGTKGKYGYTSEGVTGFCYPKHLSGTIPLYRYCNANSDDHFYTTDINEIGTSEKGQVGKYGYKDEGIACYVFPALSPAQND